MQENHLKTIKVCSKTDEQRGWSEGRKVASRRRSIKLKLDGNIARRNALPLGITWDTELPGFGLLSTRLEEAESFASSLDLNLPAILDVQGMERLQRITAAVEILVAPDERRREYLRLGVSAGPLLTRPH